MEHAEQRIRQLTFSDPFSMACGIRCWFPGYRWPLNTGLKTWHDVIIIVPRPHNGIRYCSWRNLISVCGEMKVVDGYGGYPDKVTYKTIPPSFKPALY
ncbi:hypothetical protein TNCV_255091 [Trichonephila clavipes]|nr:hypothetical protein TNCV_255091 [Trichonephila clavipes]